MNVHEETAGHSSKDFQRSNGVEEGSGEVDTASRDSEGIDIQLRTTFVNVNPCLSYEGVGLVNEHSVSSDVHEDRWM